MKTDDAQGVPKDVGTGVFRDADGDIIPRSRFDDGDLPDVGEDTDPAATYVLGLRAGLPRNPQIEAGLDQDRLAELLPDLQRFR